jgi:hypothetical protein
MHSYGKARPQPICNLRAGGSDLGAQNKTIIWKGHTSTVRCKWFSARYWTFGFHMSGDIFKTNSFSKILLRWVKNYSITIHKCAPDKNNSQSKLVNTDK